MSTVPQPNAVTARSNGDGDGNTNNDNDNDNDNDGAAVAKLEAEIQKHAPRVTKHMNEDHEDSLVAYVLAFATGIEGGDNNSDDEDPSLLAKVRNRELAIASARLTALDTDGFLLEVAVVVGEGDARRVLLSNVRVPYDRPIKSARELHAIAVAMHRTAYDQLGVLYKVEHGYYRRVWEMAAHTAQKALAKRKRALVAVAGVVAMAGGYFCWMGGNQQQRSPKTIQ
eukprot:jgi/Psemu1/304416/fgenesh1_kg.151_\